MRIRIYRLCLDILLLDSQRYFLRFPLHIVSHLLSHKVPYISSPQAHLILHYDMLLMRLYPFVLREVRFFQLRSQDKRSGYGVD